MAYVNQEKKAKIAAAIKAVMPAGFRYTLAVRNYSTIVLTVRSAPVNLLQDFVGQDGKQCTYGSYNVYHFEQGFSDQVVCDMLRPVLDALNLDNHDRSDIQSDYFDVGHYVDFCVGQWNKPFVYTGQAIEAAAAQAISNAMGVAA